VGASTTVRVDQRTHETLRRLATDTGEPMAKVLARAITEYRRKIFWEESRRAVERVKREQPELWAEYKHESEMWELASLEDFEKSVPPYFDADHPR
jgi:predicted transcriptional regulator